MDPSGLKKVDVEGRVEWLWLTKKKHTKFPVHEYKQWPFNYSFKYECKNDTAKIYDFDPGDVSEDGNTLIDSAGFSLVVVGVTWTDKSKNYIVDTQSEVVDCPDGTKGSEKKRWRRKGVREEKVSGTFLTDEGR